jgi:transposase
VIGRARRPLMAFVMVLSYSRHIFLRFFLNARMENFLRGHVGAFETWNGVPKVVLYDNLKSAVLERQGNAIRFHPTLVEFAGRYRFEPRPVAVARGNEKAWASYYTSFVWLVVMGTSWVEFRRPGLPLAIV